MSATTAFWVSLGLQGTAVVLLLLTEMTSRLARLRLVAAGLLLLAGAIAAAQAWLASPTFVTNAFVTGTGFSAVAGIVVVLTGLAIAADANPDSESSARGSLMALAGVGAFLAVQAADLVVVIIALEVCAVSAFAIVASHGTRTAHEAAVKYLIQSSVATAVLILGTAALAAAGVVGAGYGAVGQIVSPATYAPLVLGSVLVLVGLAFKSGAAPLHAWAPDAYQEAPPVGGAILGGVVKAGSLAALVTAMGVLSTGGATAQAPLGLIGTKVFPLIGGLAIASMIVGSTVALRQRSYLRLLGYAGVAQVGFALLGVASGQPGAAMLAIVTYAVAAVAAFVFAQAVVDVDKTWDGSIDGLKGIAHRSPALGVVAVVVMMSLAGIPPLAGFWGKLEVLRSAMTVALGLTVQSESGLGLWYAAMTVVAVLATMVSVAYYGAVVRTVYDRTDNRPVAESSAPKNALVVSAILAVVIVAAGAVALAVPYRELFGGFGL